MSWTHPPTQDLVRRGVSLTAALAGWCVLVVSLSAFRAAPAAVAGVAPGGAGTHATAGLLSVPARIRLNTANWSGSAGFGSRPPAWYIDKSGIVHLQGAAKQTSRSGGEASILGTLPKAARPSHSIVTLVHTYAGTYSTMSIGANGTIFVSGPPFPGVTDLSFVSLEGVTYRPAGSGIAIRLNSANYANSGSPFRRAAWFTDDSGVVHLQGAVAQISSTGSGANLIGRLPAAARPTKTVYTIVLTTDGYADLAIESNGQLALINPRPPEGTSYSIVSLESISYRRADTGNSIRLNTANWSGKAGFGSRAPRWYTDKSGIVHLQGAVTQTSSAGAGANVIGTLPLAARPAHNVFTIVHTFNGTYADLAIGSNGQITVIAPRLPLITDFTFVSLESITYRR